MKSENVEVSLNSDELIYGYQFTLDLEYLTLVNIGGSNFYDRHYDVVDNKLLVSYDNIEGVTGDLLKLSFVTKSEGQLSDFVNLEEDMLGAEAYIGSELQTFDLRLEARDETEFNLRQNNPNPFKNETVIEYNLPTQSSITLSLYDVNGVVKQVVKTQGNTGYNSITLYSENLIPGVYYYKLESEEHTATKSMLVIK